MQQIVSLLYSTFTLTPSYTLTFTDHHSFINNILLQVFLALTAVEKKPFLLAHISQMMEVALRVRLHGGIHSEGVQGMDGSVSQSEEASIKESKAAASELLEALEAKVGSSAVLGRYADIQRMLQASKAEKKRALASEAVKDPKAYAVRKVTHAHICIRTQSYIHRYLHKL
jgi:hypothetical protein